MPKPLFFIGVLFCLGQASAEVTVLSCPHALLRESFKFGNAYDAYVAGTLPTLDSLRKKRWILKGVANQPKSPFIWGTAYEPSGYAVDHRVPELEFFTRAEAIRHEETPAIAIFGQSDYWVFRNKWGAPPAVRLPGDPVQVPSHWTEYPALKRESVTWDFPLRGKKEADLFVKDDNLEVSSSQFRLYCRMSREGLLCMGELYVKNRQTLVAEQISLFLLFEPEAKR